MEYREIVAVTGLTGLYQLLTTKSDGAIVRNVADKTTRFISARQHNVTPLESIEVYTTGENVRLHNVFQKMKEQEEQIPLVDAKSADNKAIKIYFKCIFPDFDDERVYVSDMKKMLKWYEVLKANDLLRFDEQEAQDAEGSGENETGTDEVPAGAEDAAVTPAEETTTEPAAQEAPGLSAAEAPVAAADAEEKPKKTAKKNKAEGEVPAEGDAAATTEEEEKPAKKAAKKKKTEE